MSRFRSCAFVPKFQRDDQRQSRGMSNAEYYTALKGESWKFELMRVIDDCMRYAGNREEFLALFARRVTRQLGRTAGRISPTSRRMDANAVTTNYMEADGNKALSTENTKFFLTAILNDTKKQLSNTVQETRKWILCAALCSLACCGADDGRCADGATEQRYIDSKRRKSPAKKTALGHAEDDHEDWNMEQKWKGRIQWQVSQLSDRKYKITISNGYRTDGRKICKAKTIQGAGQRTEAWR